MSLKGFWMIFAVLSSSMSTLHFWNEGHRCEPCCYMFTSTFDAPRTRWRWMVLQYLLTPFLQKIRFIHDSRRKQECETERKRHLSGSSSIRLWRKWTGGWWQRKSESLRWVGCIVLAGALSLNPAGWVEWRKNCVMMEECGRFFLPRRSWQPLR